MVAGCLVERFRNDIRQNIPEVDAVVGTGELEAILAAAGVAPAPAVESPFRILQSRAEGDARAAQGRFSRETWDGAIADLPNYLYDEATPRVLATPAIPPTSRLPRAAIIPARSASFLNCAASSGRGVLSRSSPRRNAWRGRACAKSL